MKHFFVICTLILFSFPRFLSAQQTDMLDFNMSDIDSLFDEPLPDSSPAIDNAGSGAADAGSPMSLVRQRGFAFEASYEFLAGLAPGWQQTPWASTGENAFSWGPAVKMYNRFSFDAQLSEVFRVRSTIYFQIPSFDFTLGDFFFDYSLYDTVFIRAGKYNLSWGISPNYGFTNLLARVPETGFAGDSFILKADVPIGVGGFQFLALTRANLIGGAEIQREDLAYGGKFNLALRRLDMDIGVFNQETMPLRGFLSLKTTLWNTELYNEWIISVDTDNPSDTSGAVNIGFARDFFDGKLTLNGEFFYNAEGKAFWYTPETSLEEAKKSPFIEGLNGAVNLLYRIDGKGSPRLFVQARYAPQQNSAQLVPGLRLSPWPNAEFYLAVPMNLGSKTGYYYENPADPNGRQFSIILLLTLNGSVQFGHYY